MFLNERVENIGIKLYNTVPNHIQELDIRIFKKGLKVHHLTTFILFRGRIYLYIM
jgi:hypothetical protein